MKINFEEIKKQQITLPVMLDILEMISKKLEQETFPNFKMNEMCNAKLVDGDIFEIELAKQPNSLNDILMVSADGNKMITPKQIEEIRGNKVRFTSKNISVNETLFVTYKY